MTDWRSLWIRVPFRIRKWLQCCWSASYRHQCQEEDRLQNGPRYQAGSTDLPGCRWDYTDGLTCWVIWRMIFQEEIYRFRATRPDPLILDGGANIGLGTLYFKKQYPQSRIIAFEPDPGVAEVFRENLRREGLTGVELHEAAVWTEEGRSIFSSEGSDAGSLGVVGGNRRQIEVRTVRLKSYLNQPIDFLKLDIEGAEAEVIEDCASLLQNVKLMFVEYHSFVDRPQALARMLQVIQDAGFRVNIQSDLPCRSPLFERSLRGKMDMTLNIFAYREEA